MADEPRDTDVFRPTGFFAFRTALLPLATLTDWADGATSWMESCPDALNAALECDRTELRHRLKAIVARPEVREALFLASPAMSADLEKWLATPAAQDRRLEQTLARYVQRMAARATPFGLFAGCSVGRLAEATNIETVGLGEYRRYSRVDNDHLEALTMHLAQQEEIRNLVRYRPNTSLYRLAARWRYVRTTIGSGVRRHNLVALDADEFLNEAVNRAADGATVEQLVDHIVAADPDHEITSDEAREYVLELVSRQVLVSDLSPIVTGPEALDDLVEQLRPFPGLAGTVAVLEQVRGRLKDIDHAPLGTPPADYKAIEEMLATLGVPPDPSRLFQVDMTKPAPNATIGEELADATLGAVRLLNTLSPPSGPEPWAGWRDAFVARYERREMPLFEVLDEEAGIGFRRSSAPTAENAPLLNGVRFPPAPDTALGQWTSRDVFLLSRLSDVLRQGGHVLELTDADVAALTNPSPPKLADALAAVAVVDLGPHADGQPYRLYLRGAHGPSGANLLGRFCHADPELHERVREHLALEEACRPDVIFADIVHLPEGRLGNVIARPLLRQYEIVYLGRSGAPLARRLPVSDLLVSVRDDRVVLRSARLRREVVPRLTNAHNFTTGQGVYHFLGRLQTQASGGGIGWNWGGLERAPWLPRVTFGRVVLERERWRAMKDEVAGITKGDYTEQFRAVQRWRAVRRLPRWVVLSDGDNELPVDFDNLLSIDAFVQVIKKRDSLELTELFPGADRLCAHGPEGRFVHQLVVPFARRPTADASRTTQAPRTIAGPSIRRSYAPGSDWLYLKWYAGTAGVDSVLADIVPGLIERQMATGAADRWFFLRYSDPDWHLRLRLHGCPTESHAEAVLMAEEAVAPALADGRVWRVQVDTYEREIERYGGDEGITLAEEFFHRDSEAVLEILRLLPGDEGMDARWRLCLRGWDLLLSDFGFPVATKRELTRNSRASYARQLHADKRMDVTLGTKFRAVRKSLEALFDERQESAHPLAEPLAVLRKRSAALEPVMHRLLACSTRGRLTTPLPALAGSYLHMHANRLLRSAHRHQEFVLYDFLDRIYESQLGRAKGRGARPVAV